MSGIRIGRRLLVAVALLLAAACGGGSGDVGGDTSHELSGDSSREVSGDLTAHGAFGRAAGFDVLLVTLDTVRADHLGCYGYADAATPVIDALASRGLRFDQALATTPITLPSHSSIMTGLYAPGHGVRDNGYYALGAEANTLAEALRDEGYATAAYVAAYVLDKRYGLAQGFDHYDDAVTPSLPSEARTGYNERPADVVTTAALTWLEDHLGEVDPRPYFLWVHYFDPHWPYTPPPPFASRFAGRPYDGEIAFVDTQIGRLVDLLEQRNRLDRTLVVVTADHGDALGEHGETTHTLFVYDATMRVPWILSCPALFGEGLVVADRVVSIVDVMPTVLDMLGVERGGVKDGINPLSAPPGADRAVYVETIATLLRHGFAPLHGLRRLEDKYIHAPRPEYYDIAADPGETENLFEQRPGMASALSDQLAGMMASWERAEAALQRAMPLDAQQAERLAALGYVTTRVAEDGANLGDPKDLVPHFTRVQTAKELSDAGRHAEAVRMIAGVVAGTTDEPYAWKVAALIYQRVGRYDRAEETLSRALELQPDVETHVSLAQVLVRRGAFDECARHLDLAEQLDPLHGDIYITRGDLYAVQRDYVKAIEEFRRAERVDPIRQGATARAGIAQAEARLAGGR
jgi:arylsulfatase A-like enzyme/predicted negative regulator of RcsB-dependent stress response